MSNINTDKKLRVIDTTICVVMGALYAYAAWVSKRHIDVSFVIRTALVFWFAVLAARGARLLQYIATFNVDLTRYIDRDLDSMELPLKYKFRDWKSYLKEPFRKARPFYIIFFLIYVLHIFIKITDAVYFITTGLLLLAFLTRVILSIVTEVDEHIVNLYTKYEKDLIGQHRRIEIFTHIKHGLVAAVAFDLCLMLFFDIPKYHYISYYLAFSLLYSFSTILLHLYRALSEAIYSVIGHKFNKISFAGAGRRDRHLSQDAGPLAYSAPIRPPVPIQFGH